MSFLANAPPILSCKFYYVFTSEMPFYHLLIILYDKEEKIIAFKFHKNSLKQFYYLDKYYDFFKTHFVYVKIEKSFLFYQEVL